VKVVKEKKNEEEHFHREMENLDEHELDEFDREWES
jgi:hypothetical protein